MKLSPSIDDRFATRVRTCALGLAMLCTLSLTGCAGLVGSLASLVAPTQTVSPATEEIPWGMGDPLPEEPELSPPTTDTTTMIDPVAGAFTVDAPVGWSTTAYSTGMFSDHRQTVVSVSPDGNTVLFSGDPYSPAYWSPSHAANQSDIVHGWVNQSTLSEWSDYQHATVWVENWVLNKFGSLDGFVLLGTEEQPELAANMLYSLQQQIGGDVVATAARTTFLYEADAGTMTGLVTGETFGNAQTWSTLVRGLSTLGNIDDYEPMLTALSHSQRITPEWQSKQNEFWQGMQAQSEAFTQQLIDNHNANMAWIRNSSAAHQAKMQGIWAANDASMNTYYQRMESMDSNQRSFLNFIQGENTVRNDAGQVFQVAQGADVYYVNPSTGAAVGGNINFSEQDLIAMGLNPSDWTLTEVIR